MSVCDIAETKDRLYDLIERTKSGEEIIILKSRTPVAKLIRYKLSGKTRKPGALKGKIHIADDFDKLSDDVAKNFGIDQ
jgi:antitoxin (DNA-binding transcriptional repressor) of toxin-antitoxin stability system